MLLDPSDWALSQRADEVLSQASEGLAGRCAAETHEAALELRTAPHHTVREAIAEMRELRGLPRADIAAAMMAALLAGVNRPSPAPKAIRRSASAAAPTAKHVIETVNVRRGP